MNKRIWMALLLGFSTAMAADAPVLNTNKTIVDISTACVSTTPPAPGYQYFVQQSTGATFKCVGSVLTRWDIPTCPSSPPSGTCSTQSLCKDGAAGDIWGCDSLTWRRFAVNTDKNSSVSDPGTTNIQFPLTFNVDHINDRHSYPDIGLYQTIDFNSTNAAAQVSSITAAKFEAKTSQTTAGRVMPYLFGTETLMNVGGRVADPMVNLAGHRNLWQVTVQNQTILQSSGIELDGLGSLGSFTTIANHYGILITDQSYSATGVTAGDAIRIDSQTTTAGVNEGNLRMAGGAYNTGHLLLGSTHIWESAAGTLRTKGTSNPSSSTDGFVILNKSNFVNDQTGQSPNNHGVMMWGRVTETNANFDTGDEVCQASGLTCQTTFNPGGTTVVTCVTLHALAQSASTYYMALCQ